MEVKASSVSAAAGNEGQSVENVRASSRRPDGQKDLVWSDRVGTAQGVIWGEQISNTIRKLKSLTFFAVGTKPQPSETPAESTQAGTLEEKNKRKVKGTAGTGRGGRKGRNGRQSRRKGGSPAPPMGSDETVTESAPPVVEPVFGLQDVANYECVSAEGVKMDVRDNLDNLGPERVEENEKRRKRRSNANGDKPNNTYTEIITTALEEHPEGLTVSEIYEYISSRYGYYQPNDDRWKNSVRHNLSISPYFHKGEKSKNGAGHVWTIAEDCRDIRISRRRNGSGLIPKAVETVRNEVKNIGGIDLTKLKTETDFAVASILTDYTRACSGEEITTCPGSPKPSLELVYMPRLEAELENNNCLVRTGANDPILDALNCTDFQNEFENMDAFGSSDSSTQIMSGMNTESSLCVLEEGEIVDVEGEGMILNLNSYFHAEELQAILLDQSLDHSLSQTPLSPQ